MDRSTEAALRPVLKAVRGWSLGAFVIGCVAGSAVTAAVLTGLRASQELAEQLGEAISLRELGDFEELRHERTFYLNQHLASHFLEPKHNTTILVIGDEAAEDVLIGLRENLDASFEVLADEYRGACHHLFSSHPDRTDKACARVVDGLRYSLKLGLADEIFISFRDQQRFRLSEFAPFVAFLRERAKPEVRIVLVGGGPEFPGFQEAAATMLAGGEPVEVIEQKAAEFADHARVRDGAMKSAAAELGIEFVSKYDIVCATDRCEYLTDEVDPIFVDEAIMSVAGATWFGARLKEVAGANWTLVTHETIPDMTPEQAAALVQQYAGMLGDAGLDGQIILDVSALPASKPRIRAAIFRLLAAGADPETESFLRMAALTLAFFQPDIGPGKRGSVTDPGPDGQTYSDIVNAEMADTGSALDSGAE